MLAVSHCQQVGIGGQDFEPGLSVLQDSACCCMKPPSIAFKSCACVGPTCTRVVRSLGPAQTATESWSYLPTSLGCHVLDLALSAPAPSTARVFPLPVWDPLASTVLASEVGKPLPPCSSPLLLPAETPTIRCMVQSPGGDPPLCTAPGIGSATAASPALPSQAWGSGRERDQVAAGISAQPLFERCSPSPRVPYPEGDSGHKHRRLGKQSWGGGCHAPSAFLEHPLHPPIALVLRGL